MTVRVLIICSANVCRSPLAEAFLQVLLPDANVSSAGLYAIEGKPLDPVIASLLLNQGIDRRSHRSRRAELDVLEQADLILTMESVQKYEVERCFPETRGKVFCFDLQQDVPDPYGKNAKTYEVVTIQIASHSENWARRIKLL